MGSKNQYILKKKKFERKLMSNLGPRNYDMSAVVWIEGGICLCRYDVDARIRAEVVSNEIKALLRFKQDRLAKFQQDVKNRVKLFVKSQQNKIILQDKEKVSEKQSVNTSRNLELESHVAKSEIFNYLQNDLDLDNLEIENSRYNNDFEEINLKDNDESFHLQPYLVEKKTSWKWTKDKFESKNQLLIRKKVLRDEMSFLRERLWGKNPSVSIINK